jgi:8-amino-7-oxononanoate synthase
MNFPTRFLQKINQRIQDNELRYLDFSNDLIDFYSNDYLGFARNEVIFEQVKLFLNQKKITINGATGSRLISGNLDWYVNIEQEIATFHQVEKALIYNNGYAANLGLISAISQKDCVILYDQLCHASILDGIRLGFAKFYKYPHLNDNYLENLLQKYSNSTVFVITESLFSMDGTIPDLQNIVNICEKYNAYLIVDEAHAIGVLGNLGSGLVQQLGIQDKVFARVVAYGKAMGCHGAAVLGSEKLYQYLVNFSRSFIYSTALSPHAMATIKTAYKYLNNNSYLVKNLQEKIALFGIDNNEFKSNSPIQTIKIGDIILTKNIENRLKENGFQVKAVLSPTVAKGSERLRICLHEYNTNEDILKLKEIINQWKKEYFL